MSCYVIYKVLNYKLTGIFRINFQLSRQEISILVHFVSQALSQYSFNGHLEFYGQIKGLDLSKNNLRYQVEEDIRTKEEDIRIYITDIIFCTIFSYQSMAFYF